MASSYCLSCKQKLLINFFVVCLAKKSAIKQQKLCSKTSKFIKLCKGNITSELVCVQLLKSVCLPVILYALVAVSPTKTSINMLDNLINRAIYRLFNFTSQDNILFTRSMFNITPVSDVVQMRVSTFIDHYKHVVPFGELVVKYAVQFH